MNEGTPRCATLTCLCTILFVYNASPYTDQSPVSLLLDLKLIDARGYVAVLLVNYGVSNKVALYCCMRRHSVSALARMMACCQFGSRPSSESMMVYDIVYVCDYWHPPPMRVIMTMCTMRWLHSFWILWEKTYHITTLNEIDLNSKRHVLIFRLFQESPLKHKCTRPRNISTPTCKTYHIYITRRVSFLIMRISAL